MKGEQLYWTSSYLILLDQDLHQHLWLLNYALTQMFMRPEFDWYSEDSQYILSPSHLVRRKQCLVGLYSFTASGFSLSENKIMQNTRFKKKKTNQQTFSLLQNLF